jgi:hypothetical protein
MSSRICRTVKHVAIVAVVAAGLGGCALFQPPQPSVQVVADSYCLAAKKRTWDINDTPDSIQEAIRINSGIDRACGKSGKPVS